MPSTTRGDGSVMANLDQPFDARLQTRDLLAGAQTTAPFAPLLCRPFLACGTDDGLAVPLFTQAIGGPGANHLILVLAAGALAPLARDIDVIHQQPRANTRARCGDGGSQYKRH